MQTYILLANYTEQGLRNIEETLSRTEEVRNMARKAGITMKESYWVLGPYDVAAVFEAPDELAMTSFALSVARLGNVKTHTMRAFPASEMQSIISRIA